MGHSGFPVQSAHIFLIGVLWKNFSFFFFA